MQLRFRIMALVQCDNIESKESEEELKAPEPNEDLEDGEIEDDDEEEPAPEPPTAPIIAASPGKEATSDSASIKSEKREKSGRKEHRRGRLSATDDPDNKKTKHMTEAEKSILHLRKRERMQREKWEKYRKEQVVIEPPAPVVDDFASNLEKALASVLKKDKTTSENDEEEVKRGRKRKAKNKGASKQAKKGKESPEKESNEPGKLRSESASSVYDSESSDERRPAKPHNFGKMAKKNNSKGGRWARKRQKSRERKNLSGEMQNQAKAASQQSICVFFLQGKCPRVDCPYSHEVILPMKLELCKFYLNDCCAKGGKCSYMHSEFPCKFYHTGLACTEGDNCKFAHGKALSEGLTQILFKHIETAPREILGGFPRMSQDEVLSKINQTQQMLKEQFGQESGLPAVFDMQVDAPPELAGLEAKPKTEKRNRPSRWQDPDPPIQTTIQHQVTPNLALFVTQPQPQPPTIIPPTFPFVQDQDMRLVFNGDIDMRSLGPMTNPPPTIHQQTDNQQQDIDIRLHHDIDIRQIPPVFEVLPPTTTVTFDAPPPLATPQDVAPPLNDEDDDYEKLEIVTGEEAEPKPTTTEEKKDGDDDNENLANLAKPQRDLFLRIQAQQKVNEPVNEEENDDGSAAAAAIDTINWYSDEEDDEDEDRLTIKVDNDDATIHDDEQKSDEPIKPIEMDLSKIDISAEVTKLLTSISQTKEKTRSDPRLAKPASIYEQGAIVADAMVVTTTPESPDEGRSRPDVDLRHMNLPFSNKGILNYTPAKEIDASINSHAPLAWKVDIVEIPRPDYTGLKLNIQDAEKTGDPRLKKIFRLSVDEKESPASPKAVSSGPPRIDPRLKAKQELEMNAAPATATPILTYNQQLSILQSSAFFQSLTTNQKVLLNQELANRNEQSGMHDPLLNSLLTNLNLVPNSAGGLGGGGGNPMMMGAALSILANVNKMAMGMPAGMLQVQPGLLGAAPGIPNSMQQAQNEQQFPVVGFDPRVVAGNLPGNSGFNSFQEPPPGSNYPFVDDFYPGGGGGGGVGGNNSNHHQMDNNFGGGGGGGGRDNRNFNNRDNRRNRGGRNNFNRNGNRNNFRNRNNNRNNRHGSP